MSISDFGRFGDHSVQEIKLRGACGAEAPVITYGGILRDLVVPMGAKTRRVLLGYRSLQGQLYCRTYLEATVGRHSC